MMLLNPVLVKNVNFAKSGSMVTQINKKKHLEAKKKAKKVLHHAKQGNPTADGIQNPIKNVKYFRMDGQNQTGYYQ